MTLLSDRDIVDAMRLRAISVSPFRQEAMQPASLDVHLCPTLRVPDIYAVGGVIDVLEVPQGHTREVVVDKDGFYPLGPGDFVLGSTEERVSLAGDFAARAEGVSSLGRLGLSIHETAGFLDPGFYGQVTLEIKNNGPFTIKLRPCMRIAQVAFFRLSSPALKPYGVKGHYQGQVGPTESRYRMGVRRG